jgi:hypothetical protein
VITLGIVGQPGIQLSQVAAQHLARVLEVFARTGELPSLDVPSA